MAIGTTLKIAFDASKVKQGLAGIKSSVASIAKAGMGIAKVGAAITALGAAGAIAVGALALKINAIGEAAVTSENRVKNIVKQMGLFGEEADDVAGRLIDLAKVTARQTGIDEKVIELTQAKLSTFKELAASAGAVGGAFDRATMAAINMAAAGFGTAEMNAVQLGKALNDPIKGINSLTRSGITFTAQEKAKIATLVQSNQMLKAQDVILQAIEKQVGGTAEATADASQQIRVSLGQIVEAFAKPFSKGFNSLPGALESVFPQLKAKAEQIGEIVSLAISDSINGNFDRFVAIGDLIGKAVSVGFKKSFKTNIRNLGANVLKGVENIQNKGMEVSGVGAFRKMLGMKDRATFGTDAQRAAGFMAKEDSRVAVNALKMAAESLFEVKRGLVPGSGGRFQFAPAGSTSNLFDANGNRVIEVLNRIEHNTKQGAKF